MRVAIDATVVRAPLSGVHHAVRQEALALIREAGSTELLCLATDEVLLRAAMERGILAPELSPEIRRVWRRVLWQQFALPGIVKTARVDWLLAPSYTAPLRCPVPCLLQVHDTIALRRPDLCNWLNASHMRALMPPSIRRARHVLVSASTVRDEVVALTGVAEERVTVVPLGVDPLFLAPPPLPLPPALAALPGYILFVGTIEPKKGVDILLTAYRRVAERHPEVALVLAGRDGWKCRELVHAIERWNGPGRIIRLGYVDRQLLPAMYGGALLHVMPSVEEGFGLPILEAMACGTPVVHSDHPVLLESSGGHGLATPLNDPFALADALHELLEDGHRRDTMAAAGREYAATCTWQRWARCVLALAETDGT